MHTYIQPQSMYKTDMITDGGNLPCAALYNLWNMVSWFIVKQTQTRIGHVLPFCCTVIPWWIEIETWRMSPWSKWQAQKMLQSLR